MALTNVVRRLSAAELARQPKHYGLIAYFDGWGQATGQPPMTYLRRLTTAEARHWREGWREGREADVAWRAAQQPTSTKEDPA